MLKLIFTGNLTANPESRFVNTANGQQTVCNFTVAVNRVVRGEKHVEYIRVSCWNKQAENAEKYLLKGSKVCVAASMITARAYTTRAGEAAASLEVSADDIEYLSSRPAGEQGGGTGNTAAPKPDDSNMDDGFMNIPEDIEGRLPFQ